MSRRGALICVRPRLLCNFMKAEWEMVVACEVFVKFLYGNLLFRLKNSVNGLFVDRERVFIEFYVGAFFLEDCL